MGGNNAFSDIWHFTGVILAVLKIATNADTTVENAYTRGISRILGKGVLKLINNS